MLLQQLLFKKSCALLHERNKNLYKIRWKLVFLWIPYLVEKIQKIYIKVARQIHPTNQITIYTYLNNELNACGNKYRRPPTLNS